ncbi:MAG TPA: hypothetical protein VNI34_08625 [Candidatus Nitrosotalea sp.]|nr:hypothetical protein [Candidatus Nitrosotalea sp.]
MKGGGSGGEFLAWPGERLEVVAGLSWVVLLAQALLPPSGYLAPALAAVALAGLASLTHRLLQAALFGLDLAIYLALAAAGGPAASWDAALALLLGILCLGPASALDKVRSRLRASSSVPFSSVPELPRVLTLGGLRVFEAERELTSGLLQKPTLAFIWLHLLLTALSRPGQALDRSALADEVSPGLARAEQLRRLTGQLWDLKHDLDPTLAAPIEIGRTQVRLDPDQLDIDMARIFALRRRALDAPRPIEESLARDIADLLGRAGKGEFMAGREAGLELVGGAEGGVLLLLEEVRLSSHAACSDLVLALADHLLTRGRSDQAAALLEESLIWESSAGELSSLLVRAHLERGRADQAAMVRARAIESAGGSLL